MHNTNQTFKVKNKLNPTGAIICCTKTITRLENKQWVKKIYISVETKVGLKMKPVLMDLISFNPWR